MMNTHSQTCKYDIAGQRRYYTLVTLRNMAQEAVSQLKADSIGATALSALLTSGPMLLVFHSVLLKECSCVINIVDINILPAGSAAREAAQDLARSILEVLMRTPPPVAREDWAADALQSWCGAAEVRCRAS